jgi:O-antigen ligase
VWLYLVFALWGAILTVGHIHEHGLDTIRDAALWYYGGFMVACAWLFASRKRLTQTIRWVAVVTPLVMLWIPIAFVLHNAYQRFLPLVPGSDTPLLIFKGGDMAVSLALGLAFVICCRRNFGAFTQRWPAWSLWLIAVIDFLVIATKNRGGMLAIVVALAFVIMFVPTIRVFQGIGIAAALFALLALTNVSVQMEGRELSIAQLQENLQSVVASSATRSEDSLTGTVSWRTGFWTAIWNNTVRGDRFWRGNGFGVNLATRYGYQVSEDESLRAPHNATMTVLARMGVPGLILWIAFHFSYVGALVGSILRARRTRDHYWLALFALLLVQWTASFVNASFDPYLEGPQGAIPFWCGIGIGIAALRVFGESRSEVRPFSTVYDTNTRLAS